MGKNAHSVPTFSGDAVSLPLAVIMFITRLAVRIEEAATVVLSPDQIPSHDRRLLAPQDPHSLLSRLIELRVLLRVTVTPVLQAWLAGLAKEQGGDTAKQLSLTCNVHAHLLFLHSNLQPYQLSKEAVSLVLTSFMQVETRRMWSIVGRGYPLWDPSLHCCLHFFDSSPLPVCRSCTATAAQLSCTCHSRPSFR